MTAHIRYLSNNKPQHLSGIGIGVPGQVDYKKGIIYNLTNVRGWKKVPLKDILQKRLHIPVFVDNDANAACLGESEWGAAKGYKDIVCITLGSGVGGALIIDRRLYRGRGYSATEIGHICIDKDGPQCNCGSRGCLETFAGNRYIAREAAKRLRRGERSAVLKLAENNYSKITPELLYKAAKRGDRFSNRLWREIGYNIGIGLASVVNIFNPEIIVIGGGISKAGGMLFNSIRAAICQRAIDIFTEDLIIRRAKFIEDASLVGAAALVKEALNR
jgi:glucokinase